MTATLGVVPESDGWTSVWTGKTVTFDLRSIHERRRYNSQSLARKVSAGWVAKNADAFRVAISDDEAWADFTASTVLKVQRAIELSLRKRRPPLDAAQKARADSLLDQVSPYLTTEVFRNAAADAWVSQIRAKIKAKGWYRKRLARRLRGAGKGRDWR